MPLSILHELGFLFLACGTVADGELVPEELVVMAARLKRWIAWRRDVRVVEVVEEAGRVYDQHASDDEILRAVDRCAHALGERLSAGARQRVIADLAAIARADGVVRDGEVRFLARVMRGFGMGEANPLRPADAL
ncbi:MAG: TerB family tellurite resistance protein [Myxococcales bacterium]|nr:TerB family tellurite resistance protein [Myxococcales bacterium]